MLKNFLKSAKFHFLNYVLNFKVTQHLKTEKYSTKKISHFIQ